MLNLLLTICFLRKYLFNFFLECLEEEEVFLATLQKNKLSIKSKFDLVAQKKKILLQAARTDFADDLKTVSKLQLNPVSNQMTDTVVFKEMIENAVQKKMAFEQVDETLSTMVQAWAQK
jgi:hypothetical protein